MTTESEQVRILVENKLLKERVALLEEALQLISAAYPQPWSPEGEIARTALAEGDTDA